MRHCLRFWAGDKVYYAFLRSCLTSNDSTPGKEAVEIERMLTAHLFNDPEIYGLYSFQSTTI